MELTCHRCGAVLAAEAAFCPQCGAPQVRIPEALTATAAAIPESGSENESANSAISAIGLNWRHALPAASSAGFAMAVASMLPVLSTFFPLWMLAGGLLAVTLYRRRLPLLPLTSSAAGKVGALAGLLGFLFFAFFTSAYLTVATVVFHQGEQIRATLRGVLEQAASSNHDPRTQALLQWVQTPEGLALVMAFSMFLFLVAFLLLSTAGGVFGAAMARRKNKL
ncbi:MAG: zinc ribbon domain-containing protein [Acidobacteria bacterium]|nr:zinc ribbon domain-containing protein [Acidobacteriota bacterium]